MINYEIINTGSDGNCVIIEDYICIDLGVSFKRIKEYYKKIKVVLLTHIHSDHFNKTTIKKLAFERPTIRWVCGSWLVSDLVNCGVPKKQIDVVEFGKKYDYGLFQLMPIKAYHDVENQGYRLYLQDRKVLYITDTKTLEGLEAKDYDLYLIEANYIESELEEKINQKILNNEYTYEIRVKETHLSKEQCDQFIANNANENSYFEYLHMHKER